jgi:WD40 repeat protein
MRLQLERNLMTGQPEVFPDSRIDCVEWNRLGMKLAVCLSAARQLLLFDGQTLEKREKFTLKSGSPTEDQCPTVQAIAFSVDGTRLAVGHSDATIHVYRIGQQWYVKHKIAFETDLV